MGTPVSNHLSASLLSSLSAGIGQGEAQRASVSKLFSDSKLSVFSLPSKASLAHSGGRGPVGAGNPNTVNGIECELLNTALGWWGAVESQQ